MKSSNKDFLWKLVKKLRSTNEKLLREYKGAAWLAAIFPLTVFPIFFELCATFGVMPVPFEEWKKLHPEDYEELEKLLNDEC